MEGMIKSCSNVECWDFLQVWSISLLLEFWCGCFSIDSLLSSSNLLGPKRFEPKVCSMLCSAWSNSFQRVGGCISQCELGMDEINSIIIPGCHYLGTLLVRQHHEASKQIFYRGPHPCYRFLDHQSQKVRHYCSLQMRYLQKASW